MNNKRYVHEDETLIREQYQRFKNNRTHNTPALNHRSRRWVWVENNPTTQPVFEPSWISYLIYSKEIGESGTAHWQGYIRCSAQVTLARLKKWNKRAWFGVVRGTEAQNITYISKAPIEGPFKFGEPESPGKRSDIRTAIEQINDGDRMAVVARSNPEVFVRYYKGLMTYASLTTPMIHMDPKKFSVTYIWGPTGVGKTRHVYSSVSAENLYTTIGDCTWWDGYDGQNVVLFDEFIGQVPIQQMLRFIDIYCVLLPTKGSHVVKKYHTVYITSNLPPEMVYLLASNEHRAAFKRRINTVINMNTPVHITVDTDPIPPTPPPPPPVAPGINLFAQEENLDDGDISTEPNSPVQEGLIMTPPLSPEFNDDTVSRALFASAGLDPDKYFEPTHLSKRIKNNKK